MCSSDEETAGQGDVARGHFDEEPEHTPTLGPPSAPLTLRPSRRSVMPITPLGPRRCNSSTREKGSSPRRTTRAHGCLIHIQASLAIDRRWPSNGRFQGTLTWLSRKSGILPCPGEWQDGRNPGEKHRHSAAGRCATWWHCGVSRQASRHGRRRGRDPQVRSPTTRHADPLPSRPTPIAPEHECPGGHKKRRICVDRGVIYVRSPPQRLWT
jgi:hypothetical protein